MFDILTKRKPKARPSRTVLDGLERGNTKTPASFEGGVFANLP